MGDSWVDVSRTRRRIGLIVLILLFGVVIAFAAGSVRTFKVISGSMLPTLETGDYLLVDARTPVSIHRGDVVAVRHPMDPSDWLCKRVVALPLDTVEFRDGYFYLNDEIQDDEEYVEGTPRLDVLDFRYELKRDEYFVLGDNRTRSYDSLSFWTVHGKDFIGVVVAVYWPPARARWLTNGAGEEGAGG